MAAGIKERKNYTQIEISMCNMSNYVACDKCIFTLNSMNKG